ncbi:MAG: XdhC family protein [Solirubrobacterales bacterium]|nr:XdhC family protein [Solirubrobacterales bacterium]
MGDQIAGQICDWLAAGQEVAVATVVATRHSSPRPVGAKLGLSASGELVGAVSGGCVEGAVVEVAERVLVDGRRQLLHFGEEQITGTGLPCGGAITVMVERCDAQLARFLKLAAAGRGAMLLTPLNGSGERRLLETALSEQPSELTADDVFVDVALPAPRLMIVGAVDFTGPLCETAARCGWRVFVIDPRTRFAPAERFPDAEAVLGLWPEAAFAQLGGLNRRTAVAVLTHDPKLDDAALIAALDSNAFYIGAMGSRHADAERRRRLEAAGVSAPQLARVRGPIGLDLGAAGAAETALAIMAEIVAVRHGRDGGSLTGSSGTIHAGGAVAPPLSAIGEPRLRACPTV